MKPGQAVVARFEADIVQDESAAKNDGKHQISGNLWLENGSTPYTMNTAVDAPLPTKLRGETQSTVPATPGAWGNAGSVVANWSLNWCLYNAPTGNFNGTCSSPRDKNAHVEIFTRN